ncbi:MAG: flavin reductase family protein [Rhodobacteraceae bacterium]|nr:flavin reductase family protein [Paracoccaceae bacterium]
MFFEPKNGHGLPHNPFNAIITPRPIGWISTRGTDSCDNLAPYSFFNGVSYDPPQVMFATTGSKPDRDFGKDSLANIRDTGVFCVNVVEEAAMEAMNISAGNYGREVDEFSRAGLTRTQCDTIDCARVAGAPAALECRLTKITTLPGKDNYVVFGEVTGIHMRDDCLKDGLFDVTCFRPLARLGYRDYSVVREAFTMKRPGE